ncbi:MAG: hypothetical protein ACOCWQ_01600, partial [Nanoarchaeota archaeon]
MALDLIIGGSYNIASDKMTKEPYSETAFFEALQEKAGKERHEMGRRFNHHYLWRGASPVLFENLKHLYPLGPSNVPAIVYELGSFVGSDIERAVVVGPEAMRSVVNAFNEHFSEDLKGRELMYAPEGEYLTLTETILNGDAALSGVRGQDGHTLFVPGDIPLCDLQGFVGYDRPDVA